jgi:dipeptidyl aminopeptidase/acylaminoacyl peptidase
MFKNSCAIQAAFVFLLAASPTFSTEPGAYRLPEGWLADVGDARRPPRATVSPGGDRLLLLEAPALPPVAELAGPRFAFAELQIDPRTHGPVTLWQWRGLAWVDLPEGRWRQVAGLPRHPRLGDPAFSPDGHLLSFSHTGAQGIEIWLADVKKGRARRLADLRLNAVFPQPCQWLPDSRGMICRVVPEISAPALDVAGEEPEGAQILDSSALTGGAEDADRVTAAPHSSRFAALARSQVVRVSTGGRLERLGKPDSFRRVLPSPDGRFLLVERLGSPQSVAVSTDRLPLTVEIWDHSGQVLRVLARSPQVRGLSVDENAAPPGPRAFAWRGDAGSTLVWAEAQDGGDPARRSTVRDRLLTLSSPFTDAPRILADLPGRLVELHGGSDFALATEEWHGGEGGGRRLWLLPGRAGGAPRVLLDQSQEEADMDPAEPVPAPEARGAVHLFRGSAAGAEPRVERIDLTSGATTVLWRSQAPVFELPVGFSGAGAGLLVTRRESVEDSADFFLRDLSRGTLTRLTRLPPAPGLPPVRSETLRYQRSDGVPLTATLTLPLSYNSAQGPLPALVWIAPGASPDAAGTLSPYLHPSPSLLTPRLWAGEGYAVLEPALPVVPRGAELPGESYVPQLVSGVSAAVAAAETRGLVDGRRLVAAGHSFGASAVATLLAETDLFQAGIALSGAYNRTLTPFGFQWERRTLWQAPQTYLQLSPLLAAHRIREPLLLIHGLNDPHPATPPQQSQELWRALNGLGSRARLVLLPHEGHTFQARESVLHVLAEMQEWLRRFLKAAPPPTD